MTLNQMVITLETQGGAKATAQVRSVASEVKKTGDEVKKTVSSFDSFAKSIRAFSSLSRATSGGNLLSRIGAGVNAIGALGKLKEAQAANIGPVAGGAQYAASLGSVSDATKIGLIAGVIGVGVGLAIGGFRMLFSAIESGLQDAASFAREVLNLRDITGGTSGEAAGLHAAFAASGVSQGMGMREILNIEKAGRTAKGSHALGALGIHGSSGDGIEDFTKIMAALSKMQDGVKKTRLEMDLFGTRGVAALGPLLRMTKAQTDQIGYLASSFNGKGLAAIERMNVSINLLGETILQRLVVPFVAKLAPAIEYVADKVTKFVNWISDLGNSTTGILIMAGAFGLLAGGITAVGIAMVALVPKMISSLVAITEKILATATAQAVLDALTGNWGAIAAAVAIGGVGIIGIQQYDKYNNSDSKNSEDSKHLKRAADGIDDLRRIIGGGRNASNLKSEIDIEFERSRIFATGIG